MTSIHMFWSPPQPRTFVRTRRWIHGQPSIRGHAHPVPSARRGPNAEPRGPDAADARLRRDGGGCAGDQPGPGAVLLQRATPRSASRRRVWLTRAWRLSRPGCQTAFLPPWGRVPLQAGGEAAAAELEYAMNTLGLKGVEVLAHVGDLELSDPSFEPFWAKAEALGAVVFIHPSGFTEPQALWPVLFQQRHRQPVGHYHGAASSDL